MIFIIIGIIRLIAQDQFVTKSSKQNKTTHFIAGGDTLVYSVFGMDCPGCHSAVEKQVNKLSAVDSSSANWLNQEIMVFVKKDSVLNENDLFDKIKSANFTPGEKKSK